MRVPELTEGQYRTLLLLACAAAMGAIAYSYWKTRQSADAEYARMVTGMVAQHKEAVDKMGYISPTPPSTSPASRDSHGRFRKVVPEVEPIQLPQDTPEIRHIMREGDFGARLAE